MEAPLRLLAEARAGDTRAFEALVAAHRRELRAHCYRMTGSLEDADEVLQDSLVRAWRGLTTFEGRSSLRTWLYRVTTNTCLDALAQRKARVLPADLGPAVGPAEVGAPRADLAWLGPAPDDLAVDDAPSPEARLGARESVSLAFLVALQALPPKQRAVLILREVLGFEAAECAEQLELTVAAVNSALQRGRATLAARADPRAVDDAPPPELLGRYVEAWERADVGLLVSLLREDATLAMPPIPEWLRGAADIGASMGAMVLPPGVAGVFRLVATRANGRPAFAAYALDPATGVRRAAGVHVLDVVDGKIASIVAFLGDAPVRALGLPATWT